MDGHAEWVNELFECFEYRDATTGEFKFYPLFCPFAVMCPCMLMGRAQSILDNEKICSCCCFGRLQMGKVGCCVCAVSALSNCCIPCAFSPLLGCCLMCQRGRIMDQFNIEGGCCEALKGCFCPCAAFQQFLFTRDIRKRKLDQYANSVLHKGLLRDSEFSGGSDYYPSSEVSSTASST